MIDEHYYVVCDGPLAETFFNLVRAGSDGRDALVELGPDIHKRVCTDGVFVYRPNIMELRGHLLLYVPEYTSTPNPFTPPPYLREIAKWQIYRLASDGVLDIDTDAREVA